MTADLQDETTAVLQRLVEGPESVYRGHVGVRRLWHSYRTEFDDFEAEADDPLIRPLGRSGGGDDVLRRFTFDAHRLAPGKNRRSAGEDHE